MEPLINRRGCWEYPAASFFYLLGWDGAKFRAAKTYSVFAAKSCKVLQLKVQSPYQNQGFQNIFYFEVLNLFYMIFL
ncbi:MAG: hypothetical protein KAT04_15055 [Methylococcales bacterium]|nr:hypothetical protein [Methylococcales bacterium]